jgi:hypothetical protein
MSLRHFALVLAALLPSVLPAAEVPRWVLAGILHIESRSYFTTTGIVYVDQRTGAAGELGPFQMTRDAFDLVARTGEEFERLKRDTFSDRDWFIATGRWNVGPHGSYKGAWRYAKTAQQAGGGQ